MRLRGSGLIVSDPLGWGVMLPAFFLLGGKQDGPSASEGEGTLSRLSRAVAKQRLRGPWAY